MKRLLLVYLGLLINQLVHAPYTPFFKRFAQGDNVNPLGFLFLPKLWANLGYIFVCVYCTWSLFTSKPQVWNSLFDSTYMYLFCYYCNFFNKCVFRIQYVELNVFAKIVNLAKLFNQLCLCACVTCVT